jgi:hypothetical protein
MVDSGPRFRPSRSNWRALWARLILTGCALAPYWRFLGFDVLFVTDDIFTSDIWNGELAIRALWGQALARGELPSWTEQLCSGFPLLVVDPLSMAAFAALPLAVALDLVIVVWVLIAAHGTYALARQHGATHAGAVLAGIGYAGSGYFACQLKHLGIISTVAFIPLALYALDRGLTELQSARHMAWLMAFAALVGIQTLANFPQSVYIAALAYGAYALYRVLTFKTPPFGDARSRLLRLVGAGVAVGLGAAAGAVALLPLAELGSISSRAQPATYDWAVELNYWPPNFLTFLWPYIHGDISDATYSVKQTIFWEDYGYVGGLTFVLACYGIFVGRGSASTRFFAGLTVVAYLFVLGKATPFFRVMFTVLPGLSTFRFPTRFLILVELGLCVLAAFGLSHLQRTLVAKAARARARGLSHLLAISVCGLTTLDLLVHQPRQNPIVDADAWLAPPRAVRVLEQSGQVRMFAPLATTFHTIAFSLAKGWSDLRPYYRLRELLQPNSNAYWNVPSAECYTGIAPTWHTETWGAYGGMVSTNVLFDPKARELRTPPPFSTLLRTYGVTHVLSMLPVPALGTPLNEADANAGAAYIHPVAGSARVRVVRGVLLARDNQHARAVLTSPGFDPDSVVVLHDAEPKARAAPPAPPVPGSSARIVRERADELVIRANAPEGGFLVVADTFYPGWTVRVDGAPARIERANLSVRAVALPRGEHEVRFRYRSSALQRGAMISAVSWLVIALAAVVALVRSRRAV